MGWFLSLKQWVEPFFPKTRTQAVVSFSYNTMTHLLNQLSALPDAIHSAVVHQPTRKVAHHLIRVFAEDLVPLVLVTYASQLIQDKGHAYIEDDNDNAAFISTASAIQLGLYLVQAASWAYRVRAKTQLLVRMTMITLEAPIMLNGAKTQQPMTVCKEANCSTLRFMQGSLRDIITFYTTEAAISLVEYLPVAGGQIAAALAIYHRGRYVVISVLPDLCNRHHMEYLTQYKELALSAGLGHTMGTWIVDKLIETSTGIPPIFYKSVIEQLMLIAEISLIAHLTLPTPVLSSTRTTLDPIRHYQNIIGFIFDTLMLGLKFKIPRMLNTKQPSNIKEMLQQLPWSRFSNWIDQIKHRSLLSILIPPIAKNLDGFIHDPIVCGNWPAFQETVVSVLKKIRALKDLPAVRLSSSAPDSASTLIWLTLGTPKAFTKVLLQLINDEDVLRQLLLWQFQLERLTLSTPIAVKPDARMLSLRGQPRIGANSSLSMPLPQTGPQLNSTPPQADALAKEVIRGELRAKQPKTTSSSSLANLVIRERYPKPSELHQGTISPIDIQDDDWVNIQSA